MIVGIIGSGTMGAGIAQVAAMAGHMVYVYDRDDDVLEEARIMLAKRFSRLVEKGRMTQEAAEQCLENLDFDTSPAEMGKADLIIEAIVEKLDVKQELFRALEDIVSLDCILASNTSSLSISAIASTCQNPGRVVGLHFFNPAPLMKLVEIIPALQTRAGLVEQLKALMQSWGKVSVVVQDTPAFIVNRIARPFYSEALRIYEEGVADIQTIDWAMKSIAGFRMGPFELMDFIGNDINFKVTESVFEAFYYDPRYKPSFAQKRLVDAGYLGRKSGRGFYEYQGREIVLPDREVEEAKGNQIVSRILAMLINEAIDALFWNVASAEDIELAMTMGVNYPKGLLQWGDEWGLDNLLTQLDELSDTYREDRYRASPLLRQHVRDGASLLNQVSTA